MLVLTALDTIWMSNVLLWLTRSHQVLYGTLLLCHFFHYHPPLVEHNFLYSVQILFEQHTVCVFCNNSAAGEESVIVTWFCCDGWGGAVASNPPISES